MTDHLKFLIGVLNKPPFNKNYNLITFDSLEPLQLMQLLSDVLAVIEEQPSFDIRQEMAEETAMRLFEALRILRYKPPTELDELNNFRLGLVVGDKHVIYPVLTWLLQKIPELQKRAYLAKFLVNVYVPPEFQSDPDVEQIMNKCDQLMEEFKLVHKEYSALKEDGLNSEEIRHDIQSMEQERDQITKRVDKLKKKVESMPHKEAMLSVAKQLRAEVEKETQIAQQKQEQRNGLVHAEQKVQRILQQVKELKQQMESARPEDLIQKLEEENKIHRYMTEEKLVKEISTKRKAVQELQKVAAIPAMDQNDLKQIKDQLTELNNEITELVEKKNLSANPTDDKLAIFRQQANIVQRKKDATAETLQDVRNEAQTLENELKTKKSQMRDSEGNEIVTNVQFKNYVNKLRAKTNNYKRKRADLQDLKAEIGVVQRTEEILKAQWEQIKKTVPVSDVDEGIEEDDDGIVSGPQKLARPQTAKLAGKSIEELTEMVHTFTSRLATRKREVAPFLQELRPMREQFLAMSEDHGTKKQQYNSKALSLESGYSRLEQDVKNLRADVNSSESKIFKMESEKRVVQAFLDRAKSDHSFRDKLQAKINEAEETGKKLKDQQKSTRDDQQDAARQMKMWRDLMKLMECKKVCWQKMYGQQIVQQQRTLSGAERSVALQDVGARSVSSTPPALKNQQTTSRPQSRRGSSFNID